MKRKKKAQDLTYVEFLKDRLRVYKEAAARGERRNWILFNERISPAIRSELSRARADEQTHT